MTIMVYCLIIMCAVSIFIGKIFLGKYFNHITIYSVVWTFILLMGELRLLYYYSLALETWAIIFSGWICFILGSTTYAICKYSDTKINPLNNTIMPFTYNSTNISVIRNGILFLSGISLLSGIQEWMILVHKFGSISKVLLYGNIVYSNRVVEGGAGIPYAHSLALPASFLSGIYTSYKGKITLTAIFPILTIILIAVAGMGRAQILVSLILFITGNLLTKNILSSIKKNIRTKVRSAFGFLLVFALVIGGAELVRSNRSTIESISGASKTLNKISGSAVITPSIYLYFSIHPFVLDQYLKGDGEHGIIGSNTFAPFWRILSKVGFDTYVREYQIHYATPVGGNTGTYLREIHADFGLIGIFIFPYLLGLLSSYFWFRWFATKRAIDLTILSHLYVIIAMSFLLVATRWGYWLLSFLVSLIIAMIIDTNVSDNKNYKTLG